MLRELHAVSYSWQSDCGRDGQGPDLQIHVHLACRNWHVVVPFTEIGDSGGGFDL